MNWIASSADYGLFLVNTQLQLGVGAHAFQLTASAVYCGAFRGVSGIPGPQPSKPLKRFFLAFPGDTQLKLGVNGKGLRLLNPVFRDRNLLNIQHSTTVN